jgi:hypothetical protein
MFMLDGTPLDKVQILRNVDLSRRQKRTAENRQLIMATCWADCHPAESIDPDQLEIAGGDRPIHPGGPDTPEMAGFAVAEFGVTLGLSIPSTERFIADALDLRHRLPRIWDRICRNEIDGLRGQLIARETRHLSLEQALLVDRAVVNEIGRFAWSRVMAHVEAKILEVDAERVARLVERAKNETGVWVGDSIENGTKSMAARAEAADMIWFDAMVDRIADILGRRGDKRRKAQRRAAALGVLGNPLRAIRLIAEDDAPSLFDPDLEDESLLPASREPEPGEPVVDDPATGAESGGGESSADAGTGSGKVCDRAVITGSRGDPTAFTRVDEPIRWPRLDQDQRMAEAAIRAIGELDPTKFLPKATLYVHIALETLQAGLGVTRVEDLGPIISSQVAAWLKDCQIAVKPVIDLNAEQIPIDAYEIPRAMRERVFLRYPGSMFPYSGSVGRRLDQDHSSPYRDGIRGQTGDDKLAPLARREHRAITHGLWNRRMPQPGTVVFRAPHGRVILVNETGSHDFGRGQFAHRIWDAAAPETAIS